MIDEILSCRLYFWLILTLSDALVVYAFVGRFQDLLLLRRLSNSRSICSHSCRLLRLFARCHLLLLHHSNDPTGRRRLLVVGRGVDNCGWISWRLTVVLFDEDLLAVAKLRVELLCHRWWEHGLTAAASLGKAVVFLLSDRFALLLLRLLLLLHDSRLLLLLYMKTK